MLYLGETQVWGRYVWLAVGSIYLGLKLQARSQFPAHSWAPFCTFLLAKKKQGSAKEQAPQQINCNQNWFCWAEEQRACLLQNVAVSGLECRKKETHFSPNTYSCILQSKYTLYDKYSGIIRRYRMLKRHP